MKSNMKNATKIMACALAAAAACGTFAACGGDNAAEFVVGGSSSVSPLMSVLADAYMESHEDVVITVTTTDSGTGIANAESGSYAIGMASKTVDTQTAYPNLTAETLCLDGIACIVNTNCAVSGVTKAELAALYTAGTPIQDTIVAGITREAGSGTFSAFNDFIGIEEADLWNELDLQQSTSAVLSAIKTNTAGNTVAYLSMGSLPSDGSVKALDYEGVAATVTNVASGDYGMSRPFVVMYNKTAGLSEEEQAFFDWLFSTEAKEIISSNGYVNV